MSTTDFTFDAEIRTDLGKGASRRLRHAGKLPAILYGGEETPVSLTLSHDKINNAAEHDSFYSSIITLNLGKDKVQAILKDVQRHPFKPKLVHLDFQRVSATEELTTRVQIHYLNEEEIQKQQGVVIRHEVDIEISCLPKDLPEAIEIDLAKLTIGDTIHLDQIELPEGVSSVELGRGDGEEYNLLIVAIAEAQEEEIEEELDEAASTEDTESAEEAEDESESDDE